MLYLLRINVDTLLCYEASVSNLSSKMTSTYLFFTFLLACPVFLIRFPSHAAYDLDSDRFGASKIDTQKVTLSLYYETLSPYCATFIVKNLARIFDNDLITILNLRLIPWGYSYVKNSTNEISCQHGPDECKLNSLEACAINVLHDVNKHFALIYCIQFLVIEGRHKQWQTCFSSLGLPLKPILDCYNSGNGTKLEQKYAIETMHLNPPLKFVPWVVLNNQPIGNDYENFATHVCKAYKGSTVPMACQSMHLKQKQKTE